MKKSKREGKPGPVNKGVAGPSADPPLEGAQAKQENLGRSNGNVFRA